MTSPRERNERIDVAEMSEQFNSEIWSWKGRSPLSLARSLIRILIARHKEIARCIRTLYIYIYICTGGIRRYVFARLGAIKMLLLNLAALSLSLSLSVFMVDAPRLSCLSYLPPPLLFLHAALKISMVYDIPYPARSPLLL